jgi:hypothetical protein
MSLLIQEVPTEQIEHAIAEMKSRSHSKTIHLFQYPVLSNAEDTVETVSYTLPDLYRELARRHEVGVKLIRDNLVEAAKVFEEDTTIDEEHG